MRGRCNDAINESCVITYVLVYDACFYTCILHVYTYVIAIYTCTCITSVFIQESQGYAFVMLLLAMISLHMLTFRLMVTMVAEFCSFVILIHNTGRDNDQQHMNYKGYKNIVLLFPST